MASGSPSSVVQISRAACRSELLGVQPARCSRTRSNSSCTAAPSPPCSSRSGSGCRNVVCSPSIPSGVRLVARIRSSGQRVRSWRVSSATGSTRCSQLSNTNSPGRWARACCICATGSPPKWTTPAAAATAAATSRAAWMSASRICQTSPALWPVACSSATRVFPTPAGPSRVTNRWWASRSSSALSSCARPTSDDSGLAIPGCATTGRGGVAGSGGGSGSAAGVVPSNVGSWISIRCSRPPNAGPGSIPNSSARSPRARRNSASACACRPLRYSPNTSNSQRRSRWGA